MKLLFVRSLLTCLLALFTLTTLASQDNKALAVIYEKDQTMGISKQNLNLAYGDELILM